MKKGLTFIGAAVVLLLLSTCGGTHQAMLIFSFEKTAADIINKIRENPDRLETLYADLAGRIESKEKHLEKVKSLLKDAHKEENDTVRAHKVSFYSYQTFLISCRIAAEKNKQVNILALITFLPKINTAQAEKLVKDELNKNLQRRLETTQQLIQIAETYRSSITGPSFRGQFEQLLAGILQEKTKLKDAK